MVTLAVELARRGHRVDLYCYHAAEFFVERLEAAGVNLLVHPKPARFSFKPLSTLRGILRRGGYDAVLAYLPVPSLYLILATRFYRGRPPIILSARTGMEKFRGSFFKGLLKHVYRFADHLVLNSHQLREYFTQRYRWARERSTTIWNGVEPRFRFQPPPPRAGELKLLGVGNTAYFKNWPCLIEALAILRDEGLSVTVSLASRKSPPGSAYAEEEEKMHASIARLNLTDRWFWLGERSDVEDLLAEHHALAHPSYIESLPNVVCEALACGRPVLASDTLEHPRLVLEGRTGYLFDYRSPPSLADAIRRLYHLDDAAYEAMCHQAHEFAQEHLSVERLGSAYEELFYTVIAQR